MNNSKLSFLGCYEYDNTLFDAMVFPTQVNRSALIDTLLAESSDLDVWCRNIDILKSLLGTFSTIHLKNWQHLADTEEYTYNPIANYDRTEETTETRTPDLTRTDTRNLTRTDNLQDQETRNLTSTQGTTETTDTYTYGFNSSTKAATGQEIVAPSGSDTETGTLTTAHTGTQADSGTVSIRDTGTDETVRTSNISGNIGVTSTQDLIKQEREIAVFNTTLAIIDDIINSFCVVVW